MLVFFSFFLLFCANPYHAHAGLKVICTCTRVFLHTSLGLGLGQLNKKKIASPATQAAVGDVTAVPSKQVRRPFSSTLSNNLQIIIIFVARTLCKCQPPAMMQKLRSR